MCVAHAELLFSDADSFFRCTKTRSFDNLPSACEMGGSLPANRRSSDPSLNEKWQDHRRSLELNMAVGSDGGGNHDQEVWPNGGDSHTDGADSESDDSPQPQDSQAELRRGCCVSPAGMGEEGEEAELSVVVGVAVGQMENILQEATKEEATSDVQREGGATIMPVSTSVNPEDATEDTEEAEKDQSVPVNGTEVQREELTNGHHPNDGVEEPEDGEPAPQPAENAQEVEPSLSEDNRMRSAVENCSVLEEAPCGPCESEHRTLANGFVGELAEEPGVDDDTCPNCESDHVVLEAGQQPDKQLLESSTETLTEEACGRAELYPARHACPRREKAQETGENGCSRTLNGGTKRPSVGAFQSVSADIGRDIVCNGEDDPCRGPHCIKVPTERAPLSRQVSVASCNSLSLPPRFSCSLHRWCHPPSRVAISPEQPSRSHLDDDGLTLHTDAIQQRLRQIEAGHQMEVETLKKQLQELWSRLENQQYAGSHRVNGDMGDELVRCHHGSVVID